MPHNPYFWVVGMHAFLLLFLMLSPKQARKVDPALKDLTNEQLEGILAILYGIGHLAFDARGWKIDHLSKKPLGVGSNIEKLGIVRNEL
ncbi:MAG: hypothetical protein QY323_03710 [Patescibacteria group bacterium]|nr:MAG: hypothetical protein QY323_03710 [Patescibacteria group bacterium]